MCRYKVKCEENEILSYSILQHSLEGRSFCSNTGQDRCIDSLTIHFPNYGGATLTTCGNEAELNETAFFQDGAEEILVEFRTNREHQFPGFLLFAWCAPPPSPPPLTASFQPPEITREVTDDRSERVSSESVSSESVSSESVSSESVSSERMSSESRYFSRSSPVRKDFSNFMKLRFGREVSIGDTQLEEVVSSLRPQTVTFGTSASFGDPYSCTVPVSITGAQGRRIPENPVEELVRTSLV